MESYLFIIFLIAAIVVSNLINRFFPSVSIPIIQLALGVCIAFLPGHEKLVLEPEMFFVLFIASLLFFDGKRSDKQSLWNLRKPILLLAITLVFITVVAVGYSVHWLIPSIPLAAAFALAAALAPTDAVAVGSLKEKVKIPHAILHLLEGEALINDASGLVSFQFAIAAVITGTFSILNAGLSFLEIALGGILLGLLLTLLKYLFVRWIRSLGMEDAVLHVLIEILTPFGIYLICEAVGVSGILAVVASGIAHSFSGKRLNPEIARLNMLSNNTWSVIAFVLNGLVFLLLGSQLPEIVETVWNSPEVNVWQALGYVLLITVILALLRFLWSVLIIKKGNFKVEEGEPLPLLQTALTLSLAGVKGAVTLATALSIPFLLEDGSMFPQRDLILFLVSGVILCTMLAANYLLPLLIRSEPYDDREETKTCIHILQNVIQELRRQEGEVEKLAMERVIREYMIRINQLREKLAGQGREQADDELHLALLKWQKEDIENLVKQGEISRKFAYRYVSRINANMLHRIVNPQERKALRAENRRIRQAERMLSLSDWTRKEKEGQGTNLRKIQLSSTAYILNKLKLIQTEKDGDTVQVREMIQEYEWRAAMFREDRNASDRSREEKEEQFQNIASLGFQIERDNIHRTFENDKLTREKAKELKQNVDLMEFGIKGSTIF